MNKQIYITSKTELKILNDGGCDVTDAQGELQVMNKKGEWVRVRKLGQLTYPIQFRVRFENV